jgi:hypothetical protein
MLREADIALLNRLVRAERQRLGNCELPVRSVSRAFALLANSSVTMSERIDGPRITNDSKDSPNRDGH